MAISKPCPKCQHPLSIPEPMPEKIQCEKCSAVIRFKAAAPATPPAPTPAVAPSAPSKAPAAPAEPNPFAIDVPSKAEPSKPPAPKAAAGTGFLSYLHTIIPKPIVFGFYGAMGALLGILFLGEIFWWSFHPAAQVIEPLVVSVPGNIILYPGTANTLSVAIDRRGFEGPVRIDALDPPSEIEITGTTIPADKSEGELRIAAGETAERNHEVKFIAVSPDNEKIKANASMTVYIQPTPANLRMTVPRTVTVYAGGKNTFGFIVARGRFEGPVRVEALDLPQGIHIPLVTLNEKETKGVMPVTVDKTAKLGPKMLTLELRSMLNHKIVNRASEIQLDVLPPPGKLQIAASPQVTVFPGTKNRFSVRVSRQEFKGAIEVKVTGGQRFVTFSNLTIPADKDGGEIEVEADPQAKPGEPIKGLRVEAVVENDKEITAAIPLTLNIDAPPPTIQLAVSPKAPVYPGGKTTFGVKIARARFKGPVRIDARGINTAYVTIPPIVIPADQTDGVMTVSVTPAALGLKLRQVMPAQMFAARADAGRPALPASERVDVEILPPPSDLQLTVSPDVEVYQAGKCTFTVKIARSGFIGPVQVSFNNVPPGVTFSPGTIFGNELVFTGRATIDVPAKKYEIDVAGIGPKAPDGKMPGATKKFNLIVKPFDPAIRPPLDIVFVLDVTQSLDAQIAGLKNGIGQFIKGLKDRELEARIGLIGFRDITVAGETHFEFLKFKGDLFTTDTKLFSAEVGKLQASGGGDLPESSLDAIVKAAKYPFRPKALKVLLLITDERPQTLGNSVKMPDAMKALTAAKIDQVHLIINKAHMPNYAGLQQVAKGGFFDFTLASTKTKKNPGFVSLLPLLSKEIATTIGAPEPKSKPAASPDSAPPPPPPPGEKTPEPRPEAGVNAPRPVAPQPPKAGEASIIQSADPRPPEVEQVAPPAAAQPTVRAIQSTAVYAESDRIWLLLANACWTAFLAAGIALTLLVAQKRYLRQSWPSLGELFKAFAAGVIAGVIAGTVVQWLFLQLTSGNALWSAMSRVLAWTVLGGLIGAATGIFVPNLNWKRAFVGGCVGGFVGGVGFTLVELVANKFLAEYIGVGLVGFLGRLLGAPLLGLCIGLMVALAELASRRYWLEVAFGEREIRTVTLGASAVTLGGDERQAGVFVPNAPPKAIGYRVDRNRVFCEDFTTGKTAEVPAGDQRTLANAKVRVCSASSAQPTGANLQLVVVRDVPLLIGMPLTADDIPGLEPQGSDGIVALVSRRPNDPKVFLLRNRSKQAWTVTDADGKQRTVGPGLGIELASRCEIDFGQVKGALDPSQTT
ncbi:MAG: VWA domain-containing protein [Planctomycetes bacterium]|nr:VWA domain-containing protein [Planctomycetota bacterium]